MPKSKQWANEIGRESHTSNFTLKCGTLDNRDEFLCFGRGKMQRDMEIHNGRKRKHDYKKIQVIKDKFDVEIPKKEPDLFPVLVMRRIWMALWYMRVDNLDRMSRESVTATVNWVYQVVCTGMSSNYDRQPCQC
jgi:hypothetical protein